MLKKQSLKFKLLLAFGFLSVAVLTMTGISLFSMTKINSQYGHIVNVTMPNVQLVNEINATILEANRLGMRVYQGMIQNNESTFKRNATEFPERARDVERLDKLYRATDFVPGEEALYNNIWTSYKNWEAKAFEYLKVAEQGMTDPAARERAGIIQDQDMKFLRDKIEDAMIALIKFQKEDAKKRSEEAVNNFEKSYMTLVLCAIFITVGSIILGMLFSNYINKTLTIIAEKIRGSSEQTSVASHELSSASTSLSQGATESAASLEETVSSLEELSSMVKLNSDHAKEANTLSRKSLESAELGEKEITNLLSAMSNMEKSSKKIEEIINVIDDIAFQTNLLALNAAVEAARAGEQGRGFAVVADAVRNLAGRSAVAAKDINNLIKENVEMTESGVRIANTSGTTLKQIVESAKKVSDLNAEISAASQEQANGIEQISKAMNHLDQAIQSNASSSEEVASSAQEMSVQSDCLIETVQELKGFVEGMKSAIANEQHKGPTDGGGSKSEKVIPFKKIVEKNTSDSFGNAEGF